MNAVTARARGSSQSVAPPSAPPSIRKVRPVAHPSRALMTRLRTCLAATLTWGSLDASIALIAQIGFRPAHFRITIQSTLVATNTFRARCTPPRSAAILRRSDPIGNTTGRLFVGRGRVAFEAVDGAGLGGSKGQPVARRLLQQDEELLGPLHRHGVPLVLALELALVGELTDQLLLVAARAPDRHVGLRLDPLAEVEHSHVEEDLLDRGVIDERDFFVLPGLDAAQGRQQAYQSRQLLPIRRVHVAQRKLSVVGIQRPHAADLALERQRLRLEFDPMVARDLGTDVHVGRLLQVGVAKLEDDLWIADREPVDVVGPLAKNEGVVV